MLIRKELSVQEANSTIYVHDDLLETFSFQYERKSIKIELTPFYTFFDCFDGDAESEKYKIIFNGVLGCQMITCEPWGQGDNRVLGIDFLYEKDNNPLRMTLLKNVQKAWSENDLNNDFPGKTCMVARILMSTGDQYVIACQSIFYGKDNERDSYYREEDKKSRPLRQG